MLSIICPQSHRYKEQIQKICEKLAISNYQILDPRSHDVNRPFSYVLMIGPVVAPKMVARKVIQTKPPESDLPIADKLKIFEDFKEMQRIILVEKEKNTILDEEIPRLKDLEEFLNGFTGRVLELKLPDGRIMGIYPDNQRLELVYPIERHASSIVNLARLKELFDVRKITVKDV